MLIAEDKLEGDYWRHIRQDFTAVRQLAAMQQRQPVAVMTSWVQRPAPTLRSVALDCAGYPINCRWRQPNGG
jgi:hypothetical protein